MVKINLRYEINNNYSEYNIFDNYYNYYCNCSKDYYVNYYTDIIHNYNYRKERIDINTKINKNRSQDKKENSGRQYSIF